jgi:hypothetical protein
MHDHGGADALGRRSRGADDVLALESGVEVIHFEGDVRHCPDEFVQGTVFLESHPLHAVWAGAEPRNVQAELFQIRLSGARDVGWNTQVVIAPTEFRDCRWWLVTEPAIRGRDL